MLTPGNQAPELVLCDQHGKRFRLSDLRGHKSVVLFFYPKADTTVCTMQACSFRDHFEEFAAIGTEVVGISTDDQDSQFRFAKKWKLPFTLLCDTDEVATRAFGVSKWLGIIKNRITFVIDRSGIVRAVIEGRFRSESHVREALKALR